MTFEKWLEEIEMRGLETQSIDRLSLAVAFKKGLTPAQFVEHETGKISDENVRREKRERRSVDPSTSTHLLSRVLTISGVLMYVLAICTASFTCQLLSDNISIYNRQTSKNLVGTVIWVTNIQSLWFAFATICLIIAGTMILLLSKWIRVNAKRFEADLW